MRLASLPFPQVRTPSSALAEPNYAEPRPDDLVQDLRAIAPDNVSAFVAAAVRHELDRRRLHAFVDELVSELGPSDEAEVARYSELFAATAAVADADREASS